MNRPHVLVLGTMMLLLSVVTWQLGFRLMALFFPVIFFSSTNYLDWGFKVENGGWYKLEVILGIIGMFFYLLVLPIIVLVGSLYTESLWALAIVIYLVYGSGLIGDIYMYIAKRKSVEKSYENFNFMAVVSAFMMIVVWGNM